VMRRLTGAVRPELPRQRYAPKATENLLDTSQTLLYRSPGQQGIRAGGLANGQARRMPYRTCHRVKPGWRVLAGHSACTSVALTR
jgi:hypothetical protein